MGMGMGMGMGMMGHTPQNQSGMLGGPNAQSVGGGGGGGGGGSGPGSAGGIGAGRLLILPSGSAPPAGSEEEKIYELITDLLDPDTRETALLELSKKREMYEDLALVLWGGFGEPARCRPVH